MIYKLASTYQEATRAGRHLGAGRQLPAAAASSSPCGPLEIDLVRSRRNSQMSGTSPPSEGMELILRSFYDSVLSIFLSFYFYSASF